MITKDDLQRESAQSLKYALQYIAAVTIAAACCWSFVGLVIYTPTLGEPEKAPCESVLPRF